MAAKLVLAPEVEQDLSEAYAWYESHRYGLLHLPRIPKSGQVA